MSKLIFKKNVEKSVEGVRTYDVLRNDKLSAQIAVRIDHFDAENDKGYRAVSEVAIFNDENLPSEKMEFFHPPKSESAIVHRKDVKRTFLDAAWDEAEATVTTFFGVETEEAPAPEKPKEKFVSEGKKSDGTPAILTDEQEKAINDQFDALDHPKKAPAPEKPKKGGVKIIKKVAKAPVKAPTPEQASAA